MTAPLSADLRRRIARMVEGGSSIRRAAARFDVSPSAAIKPMQRLRRTGSLAPGQIGGHRRPVLQPHAPVLRALVQAKPDSTLAELQAELRARGIVVRALSTIHHMLRRLGLRRQKDAESGRAGSARRDPGSPALAGVAALHGPKPLRVPG